MTRTASSSPGLANRSQPDRLAAGGRTTWRRLSDITLVVVDAENVRRSL
jgi:hypothetical protein